MMTAPSMRALSILVSASMLCACVADDSEQRLLAESQNPVLLDQEQVMEEYKAETERLRLAPGDRWDPYPVQLTVDPGGSEGPMMFEENVGAQTAQFQWYCSWARAATAREDSRGEALAQLEDFATFSVWQHMDGNGHALFERMYKDAVGGDLEELSNYVAEYC